MIFSLEGDDVPDLSGEVKTGMGGVGPGEVSFAVTEEQVAEAAVEAAELGKEAELIAAQEEIGMAVVVDVGDEGGVDRGELDHGGKALDAEAAVAFVEGDDGGAEVEGSYQGAVQLGSGEELLDGTGSVVGVAEVLFFDGGDLIFHVALKKHGHVFTVNGSGEDLVGDAVVIEVVDPEFDGVSGIGMEVEVLTDIAQDEIGEAIAVEVGDGHGLPPAEEVIEVGGGLGKVVAGKAEEAGRHPFAGEDEGGVVVVVEVGPGGGGDHADVGDIGVTGGGDIGEMAMAVVEVDEAGGAGAILAGDVSAADEQIGEAVAVEVAGDRHGGIDTIGVGGEGVGGEGKMAFAVAEEQAVLHLAAEGGIAVAAGSDEQVEVAVTVGIEEKDGLVLKVGELVEGGLGLFDEPAGGGLEVELAGVTDGAADIDVGEAVVVDVAEGGFGAFTGK